MLTSLKNNQFLRGAFTLGKGDKLLQDNPKAIVKQVFWKPGITQREISAATKIPQQSVSRLVNSLLEDGIIRGACDSGKPSSGLEPNPNYAYCYGLSILLDAISIALMNFKGEVVATKFIALDDMGISAVLSRAVQEVEEMSSVNNIDSARVLGIGVGISGFFSSTDGKMNTHHAIEEWADINIAETVAEAFQLPSWVVNDGTGAAAGEGIAGAGRRYKNFVYFFVSTAFGGGLINNGDMIRGTHGNAGELGDMLPAKLYSHPNLKLLERILLKHGVDVPSMYQLNETFDPDWPGVDEWIYKVQDSLGSTHILRTQP
ncbi:ROK family transcriptional regulator [Alteromonas hispanica]|uniref:ROK family transcriptional regulator n=1 Tax=Alteromonas hispanica TaxID=315421 RepID=UPI001EF1E18B|nr:ROK family transcriptional regulator [Alteromonas hispanica]